MFKTTEKAGNFISGPKKGMRLAHLREFMQRQAQRKRLENAAEPSDSRQQYRRFKIQQRKVLIFNKPGAKMLRRAAREASK